MIKKKLEQAQLLIRSRRVMRRELQTAKREAAELRREVIRQRVLLELMVEERQGASGHQAEARATYSHGQAR